MRDSCRRARADDARGADDQKTNQFNLTTRRYEVTDLARFMESPKHSVLMLDYHDRFGDEGSVGLAILDL
jgi:predicted enzyme involved in methoxymalonyl-ACP biosynthesis